MSWSAQNPRDLPWKETRNPYVIWVSEIILQQTRIEQGTPYFLRFIERYPSIFDLAETNDDELMKIWEGLGYYRRARHMLETARNIVMNYEGNFPSTYEQILGLKGIGKYTASAIASFAYDLPHAVVDGNVIRVITRLQGITQPVQTAEIRKQIEVFAAKFLDRNDPAGFNQAIMDFGATTCKPNKPECESCALQFDCLAFVRGQTHLIPYKKEKKPKRHRHFYYLVMRLGDRIYIRKRAQKDIWQDLFEFYLIESDQEASWQELLSREELPIEKSSREPASYKQTLSHQVVYASFMEVTLKHDSLLKKQGYLPVKTKNIRNFAFPKVIDCYLREKDVILNL
jgi:A/G-specific adenine glycosylase